MPRQVYDAIFWTTTAADAKPRRQVPLTLHIQLSSGHGAQQEHDRKKQYGYKIAFRVKSNQTVDLAFVEEGTGSTISHVNDGPGAAELERLHPASGEKWVAFRTQDPKSRQPNFLDTPTGLHTQYEATLTIDPLSGPQVILCAHANGNDTYTQHNILSAFRAV